MVGLIKQGQPVKLFLWGRVPHYFLLSLKKVLRFVNERVFIVLAYHEKSFCVKHPSETDWNLLSMLYWETYVAPGIDIRGDQKEVTTDGVSAESIHS